MQGPAAEGAQLPQGYHSPKPFPDPLTGHFRPMSEAETARWFKVQGCRVTQFRDHVWVRRTDFLGGSPGHWQPVAELSPLPLDQIGWPTPWALGYRAVVSDPHRATGEVALQWIADLQGYGPANIKKRRRWYVRQGARGADFSMLSDPDILLDQGWRVVTAAGRRNGLFVDPDVATYRWRIAQRFAADPQITIAATQSGRLVGYILGYATGTIGYVSFLFIDQGVAAAGVGSTLYWHTLAAMQQAGVAAVSLGLDAPNLPGLQSFKATLGARRVSLPVVARLRPPVTAYLRRRRPGTFGHTGVVHSPDAPPLLSPLPT